GRTSTGKRVPEYCTHVHLADTPVLRSEFDVLSIEDRPDNTTGLLSSLRLEGIRVHQAAGRAAGEELLRTRRFDLLLVDQQMEDDQEAGTALIARLYRGEIGELNATVAFAFVTGSREWVTGAEDDVLVLDGFTEIFIKGDPLTPGV